MISHHPAFQKYGKYADKFREAPDTRSSPTPIGVFMTVICIPALLAIYFWYIYTTNGTVYNTSVVKATDSTWSGYITCQAEGGCWYAAVDTYYNCINYNDEEMINYVPHGENWEFKSSGRSGVLFSDNSNIDNPDAYAILLVASVNMTELQLGYNATLPTQTLWNVGFNDIHLGQSRPDQGKTVEFVYDGTNKEEYDILGANNQYSIRMTISMTNLDDKVSASVSNDDDYEGDNGITLSQYISPTFTMNADMIGSCASKLNDPHGGDALFNATDIKCGPPMSCVTATIVVDPIVTSTAITKEYSLTALFAQVGGNASNAIVILGAILTAYHYLENKLSRKETSVVPMNSTEQRDSASGKTIMIATRSGDSDV